MKRTLSGIMLSILVVSILAFTFRIQPTRSSPGTITVPDDYPTIQAAINAASPGEEVNVRAGTYYENVIVNKSLSILGSGKETTTVYGNGSGSVIILTANSTTIEGLTVRHGRSTSHASDIGVYGGGIDVQSAFNTIANNALIDCNYGVAFWGSPSHGNILINNTYNSNLYLDTLLWDSSGNFLRNNLMTSGATGGGGMEVFASNVAESINDVDSSNTVDSKPIYYWTGRSEMTIPNDAGYVVLANSTRILVRGISPININGISVLFTNETTIENCTFSNGRIGVFLTGSMNNTIKSNVFSNCGFYGVALQYNNNAYNTISENSFTDNGHETSTKYATGAIYLEESPFNTVSKNIIRNNGYGLEIEAPNNQILSNEITNSDVEGMIIRDISPASGNMVIGNTFSGNGQKLDPTDRIGLVVASEDNIIYHNNFLNGGDIDFGSESASIGNKMTNGYPSGGNYYSDYSGTDQKSGPNQDQPGSDGIADTDIDFYPRALMGPITYFNVTDSVGNTSFLHVVSNSTFSLVDYNPDSKSVTFNAYGTGGTVGFSRVDIPKKLLRTNSQSDWIVNVGGTSLVPNVYEDNEYTYLYFTFANSASTTIQIQGTITAPLNTSWDPSLDSYNQGNYASSWSGGNCYGLSSTEILYFMNYVLGNMTYPYFPAENPQASTTSQLILPQLDQGTWTTLNNALLAVMFHQVYDPNNAFTPNPSENIEYQKLVNALGNGTPALLLMHGVEEDLVTKTSKPCYHAIVASDIESLPDGTVNIIVSDPNMPQPQQEVANYDPSAKTFSYSASGLSFYEFEVATPEMIETTSWSYPVPWWYPLSSESWFSWNNWLNFSVVGYNIVIANRMINISSYSAEQDYFTAAGNSQTFVCGISGSFGIEEGDTQVYAIPEGVPFTISDPNSEQSAMLIDHVDNESGQLVGYGYFLNVTGAQGSLNFSATPSNNGLIINSGTSQVNFSATVFHATLQDNSVYQASNIQLDPMQTANLTVSNWQVLNDTNASPVTLTVGPTIPEFSSTMILALLMIVTALAVIILRRKPIFGKTL